MSIVSSIRFPMSTHTAFVGLVFLFLLVLYQKRWRRSSNSDTSGSPHSSNQEKVPEIKPVDDDFDWTKAEPRPYRPFKAGPFHLTMGVRRLDPQEWLLIESTYKDVTKRRAQIVDQHREHTVLSHPMADEPLKEVYQMTLGFLLKRYPMYFSAKQEKGNNTIVNKLLGTELPADPAEFNGDTTQMVRTLAKNMEEDFLVMMLNEDDGQYYLRGGSFAFPSGFDPKIKLNTALKDIHGPVPLYKEKIEKAMDRYFLKMKAHHWIERFNWGIQAHTNYYALSENHADESTVTEPLDPSTLDFERGVFLRCERQVLTRLPKTKALLFTIRTYITPLSQIRREGRSNELISAIDNLPDSMAHYKKREEWGEAAKAYLRFETDGRVRDQ